MMLPLGKKPPLDFNGHQLESLLKQRKKVSRSQILSLQLSDYSMNKMASLFQEYEYRTHDMIVSKDDAPYLVPVSMSEIHAKLKIESTKKKERRPNLFISSSSSSSTICTGRMRSLAPCRRGK